eukprot:15477492-Alexandrium_andersonii.AAC.1
MCIRDSLSPERAVLPSRRPSSEGSADGSRPRKSGGLWMSCPARGSARLASQTPRPTPGSLPRGCGRCPPAVVLEADEEQEGHCRASPSPG